MILLQLYPRLLDDAENIQAGAGRLLAVVDVLILKAL